MGGAVAILRHTIGVIVDYQSTVDNNQSDKNVIDYFDDDEKREKHDISIPYKNRNTEHVY